MVLIVSSCGRSEGEETSLGLKYKDACLQVDYKGVDMSKSKGMNGVRRLFTLLTACLLLSVAGTAFCADNSAKGSSYEVYSDSTVGDIVRASYLADDKFILAGFSADTLSLDYATEADYEEFMSGLVPFIQERNPEIADLLSSYSPNEYGSVFTSSSSYSEAERVQILETIGEAIAEYLALQNITPEEVASFVENLPITGATVAAGASAAVASGNVDPYYSYIIPGLISDYLNYLANTPEAVIDEALAEELAVIAEEAAEEERLWKEVKSSLTIFVSPYSISYVDYFNARSALAASMSLTEFFNNYGFSAGLGYSYNINRNLSIGFDIWYTQYFVQRTTLQGKFYFQLPVLAKVTGILPLGEHFSLNASLGLGADISFVNTTYGIYPMAMVSLGASWRFAEHFSFVYTARAAITYQPGTNGNTVHNSFTYMAIPATLGISYHF